MRVVSSINSPFLALPLRRVEESPLELMDRGAWPATLAPVRQLLDNGLDLGPMTILVGDNGSGKSTLVEAIAMAFGMNAEGGSTNAMNRTFDSESDLADHLPPRAGRWSVEARILSASRNDAWALHVPRIDRGCRLVPST